MTEENLSTNKIDRSQSICERSLWTRLTPGQNEALRCARGTHELDTILTEAGFTRATSLFVELVNHALWFAKDNALAPAQLTVLISILYELWDLCASSPFVPIQRGLAEANKLLLCHSVQRPPHSVEIFSIDLAKKCMRFIVERFFRYWKMYRYALSPGATLIPQFEYDDVADHNTVGSTNPLLPDEFLLRHQLHRFYTNSQGFLSEFAEVELCCQTGQWDIIAVTKTWLTTDILDLELSLPGMTLLRRDRTTRGGGVLLYFSSKLQCEVIDYPTAVSDSLWCKVRLSQRDIGLIGVVYRSPSSTDSANETLLQTMYHILSLNFTHVLIMGDFNCPNLANSATSLQPFERKLARLMESYLGYNFVKEPTRFGANQSPSVLGLVLANEELMVEAISTATPLGRSDHAELTFDYICYAFVPHSSTISSCIIVDYTKLQILARDFQWKFPNEQCDPLVSWEEFTNHLTKLMKGATKTKRITYSTGQRSAIRSRTKKWISQRNTSWRAYKRSPCYNTWYTYCQLRNHCTKLAREDKLIQQRMLRRKFISNPKLLYKHINAARKVNSGVPALRLAERVSVTTKEADEMLKRQYAQVFTAPANTGLRLPLSLEDTSQPVLTTIDFPPEIVASKLQCLKRNSSPRVDNIHSQTLINLASNLAQPLSKLFQPMFNKTALPKTWKQAIISPIFKGGCRSDPANYRPVTLLPVLSQVMESVVVDNVMNHLEKYVLSPAQHGFRRS
ncbi:unnamed protein product [Echinostoma caproni]|uniref:Endo/exonuclease/phosphatase domain-containing protein n=1 Tax=Echinostoma caproni TaxID=27848 RepID=A0A183B782_9TREM|nr:unnamed protein product [Echinostoma caproni]